MTISRYIAVCFAAALVTASGVASPVLARARNEARETQAPAAVAKPSVNPPPATTPEVPVQAPQAAPVPDPTLAAPTPAASASTEAVPPISVNWSFGGPFGVFDRASLQRGFQVYKEVCSACHALTHVAFRNLGEPGGPEFSQDQVRAIAATYKVPAAPDELGRTADARGRPLTRAATPADYVPPPFANEQATRIANNGALPPDLSLIVKARAGHADYVYSILTGFAPNPPANEKIADGMNYNPYFPGHQIAMPRPLFDDSVAYGDGTKATLDQEARDIATFLTWASEPKMEERKRTGLYVIMYLLLFTGLLYLSYRRVWQGEH